MIRKFIAIAALCLASSMASATVAMADSAPDICVLDLSQPVTVDQAIVTADLTCAMIEVANVASAVPGGPDDEDEVAGPCSVNLLQNALAFAGHRQHEDPGRCTV